MNDDLKRALYMGAVFVGWGTGLLFTQLSRG